LTTYGSCGAFNGALVVFSYYFGRTYELMDKDNLGLNKNEISEFNKMGAHESKCPAVVGQSAVWAVEILWDEILKDDDISKVNDIKSALKNF